MIIAIDPGTEESALLVYEDGNVATEASAIRTNSSTLDYVRQFAASGVNAQLVIEMVACYGMPVGRETFETVRWIGRFEEAWRFHRASGFHVAYRKDIKIHLCNSMKAKDANIRQALLDKFPRTGGGATPQVGTKKAPGPLYGIKSHLWSALAVAITFEETEAMGVLN